MATVKLQLSKKNKDVKKVFDFITSKPGVDLEKTLETADAVYSPPEALKLIHTLSLLRDKYNILRNGAIDRGLSNL